MICAYVGSFFVTEAPIRCAQAEAFVAVMVRGGVAIVCVRSQQNPVLAALDVGASVQCRPQVLRSDRCKLNLRLESATSRVVISYALIGHGAAETTATP
jgi:hypothetical protein